MSLAIQFGLVFVLAAAGVAAHWVGPMVGLDPSAIGAFTGALIGAAATMSGALLTPLIARGDKQSSDAERRIRIKTLIAAELFNVSAGYIDLHRILRAAQISGPLVSKQVDFWNEMPRPMPFTSALGTELLLLSQSEIDVIITLKSNNDLTERGLREFSTGNRSFGLLAVSSLSQEIAHNMNLLAQAFEKFDPSRVLTNQSDEIAAVMLRRLADELKAGNFCKAPGM